MGRRNGWSSCSLSEKCLGANHTMPHARGTTVSIRSIGKSPFRLRVPRVQIGTCFFQVVDGVICVCAQYSSTLRQPKYVGGREKAPRPVYTLHGVVWKVLSSTRRVERIPCPVWIGAKRLGSIHRGPHLFVLRFRPRLTFRRRLPPISGFMSSPQSLRQTAFQLHFLETITIWCANPFVQPL